MHWRFCFWGAVACLAVSAGLWICTSLGLWKVRRRISPFYYLFGGVFLAAVLLLWPVYRAMFSGVTDGWLHTFVSSVHHAIQLFTMDADRGILQEVYRCPLPGLTRPYTALLSAAFIVAPLLTFSAVISIFRNVFSHIRYNLGFFTDTYVFSELSDKSAALARSIRANHPRATIVFTDVFSHNEETSFELTEKAKEMRAICFRRDILALRFGLRLSRCRLTFFSIGEDEAENIIQSIKLIRRYGHRPNTHLYVFSTRLECELMLNAEPKGKMTVRRINEIQSLIYDNLYDRGTEIIFGQARKVRNAMHQAADDAAENSGTPQAERRDGAEAENLTPVNAVILGLGKHGTEMLKALAWYGQMDGYSLTVHAFDKDPKSRQRFAAQCPGLMSKRYNGQRIEGDAAYSIHIHNGVDVSTQRFYREISKLRGITYIMVCLGTDALNIRTAVTLRTLFDRAAGLSREAQPKIQAIVFNADEAPALKKMSDYRGNGYDIQFIGDLDSSYAEDIIINSTLQEAAFESHKGWANLEKNKKERRKKIGKFWDYEYYYRSSCATAIHIRARQACGIPGANKQPDQQTPEEQAILGALEHRRWNAYMRGEGFDYGLQQTTPADRDKAARTHHDIVDYGRISPDERAKDLAVGVMPASRDKTGA